MSLTFLILRVQMTRNSNAMVQNAGGGGWGRKRKVRVGVRGCGVLRPIDSTHPFKTNTPVTHTHTHTHTHTCTHSHTQRSTERQMGKRRSALFRGWHSRRNNKPSSTFLRENAKIHRWLLPPPTPKVLVPRQPVRRLQDGLQIFLRFLQKNPVEQSLVHLYPNEQISATSYAMYWS